MLSFTFFLWFFALRIFFIFEVVQVPCVEMMANAGKAVSGFSVFEGLFIVTILTALFWLGTAMVRIAKNEHSFPRLTWHFSQFIALFFLAIFTRSSIPNYDLPAPNGWMAVTEIPIEAADLFTFSPDGSGGWETAGLKACVWIDRQIVNVGSQSLDYDIGLLDVLGVGKPHYQIIKDKQKYRTMTKEEINRFKQIQECKNTQENYGKPWYFCQSSWIVKATPDQARELDDLNEIYQLY